MTRLGLTIPLDDVPLAEQAALLNDVADAGYTDLWTGEATVYAEFHRWLGRADQLEPMWQAWGRGDRAAAVEAVPDSLVDELFLHGSPADIRAGIQRYVDAGVTTPVLMYVMPPGGDVTRHVPAVGRAVTAP